MFLVSKYGMKNQLTANYYINTESGFSVTFLHSKKNRVCFKNLLTGVFQIPVVLAKT